MKHSLKFIAAAVLISLFPLYSSAANNSFEKGSWQYEVLKDANKVFAAQQPLLKKEAKLVKQNQEEKNYSFDVAKEKKAVKNIKFPFQLQMERGLIFATMVKDKYDSPDKLAEGKKVMAVYTDMQKALNANPLFKYYHLDRNLPSDFAAVTPQGVQFVKSVFESLRVGAQPAIKPYDAERYKSGAVLVYFKDIQGEPEPIMLEFYPSRSIVVFILSRPARYYGELEGKAVKLKI